MLNHDLNTTGIYKGLILRKDVNDMRVYIPSIHKNVYKSDKTIDDRVYESLPKAEWCVFDIENLNVRVYNNHPCWVMFENGDSKRPIIVGFSGLGMFGSRMAGVDGAGVAISPVVSGIISSESVNIASGFVGGDITFSADTLDRNFVLLNNSSNEWCWPISQTSEGWDNVTSGYGFRILNGKTDWHNGIDIGVYYVPVLSMCDGVVKRVHKTNDMAEGIHVAILHNDGINEFMCFYMHLSSIESSLTEGCNVTKGQVIAKSGNTGSSGGPHLHVDFRTTLSVTGSYNSGINPFADDRISFNITDLTNNSRRTLLDTRSRDSSDKDVVMYN